MKTISSAFRQINGTPRSCHARRVTSVPVDTWYQYRLAWAAHPWVILIAVVGLALIVGAIVGMVVGGPLVVLFIPGLAAVYIHHLIVQKAAERPR
jgi:hypothetical protein